MSAFSAAIPLNDGGFKRDSILAGHIQRDVPGGGGEVSDVMTAAVTLTLLVTLVFGSLGQVFFLPPPLAGC